MSELPKTVLSQAVPTSSTNAYTVATDTTLVITSVLVGNTTGADIGMFLLCGAVAIFSGVAIPAHGMALLDSRIVMYEGDIINIRGAATGLTITVNGFEVPQ